MTRRPVCKRCPLHRQEKVPPEGNPHARLTIVGEGPGRDEERILRPFVGPSGSLLDRILCEAGVDRTEIWISNATLCMPRAIEVWNAVWIDKNEAKKRSIAECGPHAVREIAGVRPRVIIALGGQALNLFTGSSQISKLHGALHTIDLQRLVADLDGEDTKNWQFTESGLTYVVPLFHPAYILRGKGQYYPLLVQKFRRAKEIAEGDEPAVGQELHVTPHVADVVEVLQRAEAWADRLIKENRVLAIDWEATDASPRTALPTVFGVASADYNISIAVSIYEWDSINQKYVFSWNREQWPHIRRLIVRILESDCPKWYHNYGYDTTLSRRFVEDNGKIGDTIVLHYLWQPDLFHNLAFVAQGEQDTPAWKHAFWLQEKHGNATNTDLVHYNAQDAHKTAGLIAPLISKVYYQADLHLFEHQMHNSEMARRMHLNGIPLPRVAWQCLHDERVALKKAALQKIQTAIRDRKGAEESLNAFVASQAKNPDKHKQIAWNKFNPRADRQGRWFLYEFLGLRPVYYTKGGADYDVAKQKPSHAGKAVLDFLNNPLVEAYVEMWEHSSVVNNVLLPYLTQYDETAQRLHVSWNATGQKGTRVTSKRNVQNLEKDIRRIFEAEAGYVWVGADLSQVEYRIAACLAGIPELLDLFNAPAFDEHAEKWKKFDGRYDAHAMVAEEVFGYDYVNASLSMKEKLRTLVKRVVYALFYGAYPQKIYDSLRRDRRLSLKVRAMLTLERIERIHEGFRHRFFEWDRWADHEEIFVRYNGYQVFPPLNRRRYWPLGDWPGLIEGTKLRNTPIQLAAGDVFNLMLWTVEEQIQNEGLDAALAIHLHDAGYWHTAVQDADRVQKIVDASFDTTLHAYNGCSVHIFGQSSRGPTVADVG